MADFIAAHAVGTDAMAGYGLENAGIRVGLQGVVEMVAIAGGRLRGSQERGVEKRHVVIVERRGDALKGIDSSCIHHAFNDWD